LHGRLGPTLSRHSRAASGGPLQRNLQLFQPLQDVDGFWLTQDAIKQLTASYDVARARPLDEGSDRGLGILWRHGSVERWRIRGGTRVYWIRRGCPEEKPVKSFTGFIYVRRRALSTAEIHTSFRTSVRSLLAAAIAVTPLASPSVGQTITEIIDAGGDGVGNILDTATGIALDGVGNVYMAGRVSNNAFKVTPGGVITEIIDASGDGSGNLLNCPLGVAVDGAGNVYVSGFLSHNVFQIAPAATVTEVIDAVGDGVAGLSGVCDLAVDTSGNLYVPGFDSHNAFKVTPGGTIT